MEIESNGTIDEQDENKSKENEPQTPSSSRDNVSHSKARIQSPIAHSSYAKLKGHKKYYLSPYNANNFPEMETDRKFHQTSKDAATARRHKSDNVKDVTDVRQMEKGLLQLLDDFHTGKLQAFGKDCAFEKMESVREQQEKLARLHFDLNAQQELYEPHSSEVRQMGKEHLGKLIENLQHLSQSIEQLQRSSVQTDV